jgi:hypothetical protein
MWTLLDVVELSRGPWMWVDVPLMGIKMCRVKAPTKNGVFWECEPGMTLERV